MIFFPACVLATFIYSFAAPISSADDYPVLAGAWSEVKETRHNRHDFYANDSARNKNTFSIKK